MIQAFLLRDLKELQSDIVDSLSHYDALVKTKYHQGDNNEKTDKIIEELGKFLTDMRKYLRPKILEIISNSLLGPPLESTKKEMIIRRFLSGILKQVDHSNSVKDYSNLSFQIEFFYHYISEGEFLNSQSVTKLISSEYQKDLR